MMLFNIFSLILFDQRYLYPLGNFRNPPIIQCKANVRHFPIHRVLSLDFLLHFVSDQMKLTYLITNAFVT
jgi:hypothetical protein